MKLRVEIEADYWGAEFDTPVPFEPGKYHIRITSTEDAALNLINAKIINVTEVTPR